MTRGASLICPKCKGRLKFCYYYNYKGKKWIRVTNLVYCVECGRTFTIKFVEVDKESGENGKEEC